MNTSLYAFATIPRTRVVPTGRYHGVLTYVEPLPYKAKLPSDLFDKELHELTPSDALAFALAADRPDRILDRIIWYKFVFDPACAAGNHMAKMGEGWPHYTGSLDAALRLYDTIPPMVSTDPLDVVCDALRIKLLHG